MNRTMTMAVAASVLFCILGGCQKPLHFPADSMQAAAQAAGAQAAYDTNADGKADYFLLADSAGRVNRIGYDRTGQQKPDQIVDLDKLSFAQCRHLVIILDGFGYDVLKEFYDQGHLRVFYPPSQVVAPYPSLTDLAIENILLSDKPCLAFEAMYFDAKQNKIVGGNMAYLQGANEPYNYLLQYRAGMIWDAIAYLYPMPIYGKEMNDSIQKFGTTKSHEFIAYYVSSAAVGTASGREGQRQCLMKMEQLINQAIWQSNGMVKVTMMADHGHSYTPAKRIPLESYLVAKGWRLTEKLQGPRDVAYIRFGLETYAAFSTTQKETLARDLAAAQGVDLASFAEGSNVVVLGSGGSRAVIARKDNRYSYAPLAGDPLKLAEILAKLTRDAEGFYDGQEMFVATAKHVYPAPLERLWRAHFGLAEHTPDVIVSLADDYYSGSESFGKSVTIASTHGSLNYRNSTTFIMSTVGPLSPLMRSAEVAPNMQKLTGSKFPSRE